MGNKNVKENNKNRMVGLLMVFSVPIFASSIKRISLSELDKKTEYVILGYVEEIVKSDAVSDTIKIRIVTVLKGAFNTTGELEIRLQNKGGLKEFDPILKKGDKVMCMLGKNLKLAYPGSIATFPKAGNFKLSDRNKKPKLSRKSEEIKTVTKIEKEPASLEKMPRGSDNSSINLARTSLALVSASSCNGDRPLSNKFYGILNAFDQGTNWVNNINYSYWSPNCTDNEWVEVEFSCPVSLDSLILEGASQCNATLYFAKGGEKVFKNIIKKQSTNCQDFRSFIPNKKLIGENKKDVSVIPISSSFRGSSVLEIKPTLVGFDPVMEDVTKIRLIFIGNNASLIELKVMGIPPVGKEFEIGFPRLKVTRKDAILEANDVYEAWIDQIYGNKAVETEIIENKENIIFLYKKDNKRLLKVIVNRKTGIGEIEKRVANKMKYKLRKQKITPYNVMQGAKITPYNVISLEKEEE